jgi:hypothetical protein
MHVELYPCIAVAIKMTSKAGCIFHHCFVACCADGYWGNTEQILTQWQGPATSSAALDMLLWAMHTAWHQAVCMVIEIACNDGAFFVIIDFLLDTTC